MAKKNLLLFCNNIKLLQNNIKYFEKRFMIYCISQDIEICVNEELQKRNDINILPYDLQKPLFFKNAWKMVETINSSFKCVKTRKDLYLYELNYLCEGGIPLKYADYLYAIAFFNKILQEYNIDIIYSEQICNSRIVDALKDIAKDRNIRLCFINKFGLTLSEMKQKLYFSNIPVIRTIISFYAQLNCFYRIKKISKKNKTDSDVEKYDIGIILFSDLSKHVNWLLESLQEIEERFKYCVFCYHADNAKERLINLGKKAKSVEGYFSYIKALRDYIDYLRDSFAIWKQVKKMPSIYFQNVNVTRTIKNLYIFYLFREKLEDIFYEEIVYKFLQKNQPKLITGNGDTNFISNKIFYFCTKKLNQNVIFYKDAVAIEPYNMEKVISAYEPYSYIMNLRFYIQESIAANVLKKQGWQGQCYYMADDKNADKYYKSRLIDEEDLHVKEKVKVLWAPSYPVEGIYSINSFLKDNETILQSVREVDFQLTVKYHPHQEGKLIKNIIKKYDNSNRIEFVNQYNSIEEYIENADIVITTLSTVIFDAAVKKKLVICLVDDLGIELSDHLKDNFYLVKSENIDFMEILYNLEFRKKQIDKQNAFLEKRFYNPDSRHIGDILQEYIQK